MTSDITLRGPGDVFAVLPFQLGYHPKDSLVVVSMRGTVVDVVLRSDLPPEEHLAEVARALVAPVVRAGGSSVIVLGFEEVEDASLPLLLAVVEGLECRGVNVVDVQVQRGGRRYSPWCSRPCCPAEGVPVPGPEDVPAVAEFVLRGVSPLPHRDAVEALVRPPRGSEREVMEAVARRAARRPRSTEGRRRSATAWASLLRVPDEAGGDDHAGPGAWALTAVGVADLATGLADVPWRDGVIAWLAPGVLPPGVLDRHVVARLRRTVPRWAGMGSGVDAPGPADAARGDGRVARERHELRERLLWLCRAVPDGTPVEAAAVCTLTAAVAWNDGDGAVARAAVDRARRLDPGYRLARLLEKVIDQGVRVGTAPARDPGTHPSAASDRLGWAG